MKFKYKFKGEGLQTAERRVAEKQFKEYQNVYHIEDISQCTLIEEKLYIQAQVTRIKKKIAQLNNSKSVKESNIIPDNLTKPLNSYLEQIIKIDEKLGLFQDRKKEENFYDWIQTTSKKAKKYREEFPDRFKTTCAFCGKVYFLNRETEHYVPSTKWFDDKVLINKPLLELYKKKRITAKEFADVMETSPDYPDWLISKGF